MGLEVMAAWRLLDLFCPHLRMNRKPMIHRLSRRSDRWRRSIGLMKISIELNTLERQGSWAKARKSRGCNDFKGKRSNMSVQIPGL